MLHDVKIQKLLSKLTPDQQHLMQTFIGLKQEHKQLQVNYDELKKCYDDLFKTILALLHFHPDSMLIINRSHFNKIKMSDRIESTWDDGNLTLKLRTLVD